MTTWKVKINGRSYEFDMEPGYLRFIYDKKNKKIAIFWTRATQFSNITWVRCIALGFSRLPIRLAAGFVEEGY